MKRPPLFAFFAAILVCLSALTAKADETGSVSSPPPASKPLREPAAILALLERACDWHLAWDDPRRANAWTRATGFAGVSALATLSQKPEYERALLAMGEENAWSLGPRRYHADDHLIGQTYLDLYARHRDPRMIAPLRASFDAILAEPKTADLKHLTPNRGDRWTWCDALFMAPATWAGLAVATGEKAYLDFMLREWQATDEHLYDPAERLYFRDDRFFEKRETNGHKIFWSRGNGWVLAGYARILPLIPVDHPGRPRLVARFREFAARVRDLQPTDGLWRSSLLDPESYPEGETSGSALFCYALAWGINNGVLDRETFAPAALRTWDALVDHVRPDGMLTHVQPIGDSPHQIALDKPEAYGAGALLLAGAEIYRLLSAADPLATLRPAHPRLLVESADWPRLRAQAVSDINYRAITSAVIAEARRRLVAPPPVRELEGRRLLWVSRRVLADAIFLSAAYHLDGDVAFLACAERNLLAAAAFSDWHPAHFLDVAEMTAALALGYDWLHAELSPATRATLRSAILEKGLRPGLNPAATFNSWHTRENNWNQVCLGGLTLGALAIAEDEPATARATLALVASSHSHGLKPYIPDGIYPEGPGYWRFGGSYTAMTLAALRSALGNECLLPDTSDYFAGARVQTLLTAPSGQPFTFADCGVSPSPEPLLFWFAQRLGDPALLASQRRYFAPFSPSAIPAREDCGLLFPLLYWQTPPIATDAPWEAWRGEGSVPVAVFHGPGDPAQRFYLAVKGGSPSDSHAHMDGGSFVFETEGIRWAEDLGMQSYHELEKAGLNIWNSKQRGERWQVFRYTNFAHNTLTLNHSLHRVEGRVSLADFSAPPAPGVSADLASVLGNGVTHAIRRFTPHPDANGVTVVDDLAGLRPGTAVTWTLVTSAEAETVGPLARLSREGRRLDMRAVAPEGVAWETASASGPAPHDAAALGFRLVRFTAVAPASGILKLEVNLAPPPTS
jgi:rhamnogalacturonyl hydrolase YesR